MNFKRAMHGCIGIVRLNLYELFHSPKVFILLFSYVAVLERTVFPMVDAANEAGYALNVVEAFTAISNAKMDSLIVPITLLILLCDLPKCDHRYAFCLFRSGKGAWLAGNIVFSFVASLMYMVSLLGITMLGTARISFWGNCWSLFTTSYASYFPEKAAELGDRVVMETGLYMHYTPFEAVALTIAGNVLYGVVIAMVQMIAVFIGHKIAGVLGNAELLLSGWLTLYFRHPLMCAFPLANARLGWHNMYMLSKETVPEWISFAYYGVVLTALCLLTVKKVRIYDPEISDETEG